MRISNAKAITQGISNIEFLKSVMNIIKKILISLLVFGIISCSNPTERQPVLPADKQVAVSTPAEAKSSFPPTVKAALDRTATRELTFNSEEHTYSSVFEYYQHRKDDSDYSVWTEKLFGRCCTEADLQYSETLEWSVTSDIDHPKYPVSQLTDTWFTKTFAFKESEQPKIDLRLDLKSKRYRTTGSNLKSHNDLLRSEDTIAYPLDLSLVNGYTKSVDLYKNNGRIKTINVFHNGQLNCVVELMDSPEIQRFSLDLAFLKNDVVTLQPISFYKGLKYDDVCLTEIQRCVCMSGYSTLNEKYSAYNDGE